MFQYQLEQLKRLLIRKRMPAAYIARALRELSDHYEDAVADQMLEGKTEQQAKADAAELIGDSGLLADAFSRRMRRRLFTGRHPWISYLFFPVPLFVACVAAIYVAAFGLGSTLPGVNPVGMPFMVFALCMFYFTICCLPSLLALRFCFNTRNTCLSFKWAIIASSLLSFSSYAMVSYFQMPVNGMLFGEFGLGTYMSAFPNVEGFINTLPIVTCLGFFAINRAIEHKKLQYI